MIIRLSPKFFGKAIAGLSVPLFVVSIFSSPVLSDDKGYGEQKAGIVDCDKGHSIQKRLDRIGIHRTLLVVGTCMENLTIDKDDVSLVAHLSGASITGTSTTEPVIRVRGNRARIVGFTLSGGSNVIVVQDGASATIEGNDISGANNGSGVLVTQSSYARVGSSDVDSGNVIHHNSRGVNVLGSSSADVFFNVIHDNERGVQIGSSSSGRLGNNTISGSDRGVYANFGGSMTLAGNSSSVPNGANTFRDNNNAIYCRFGGAMTGGTDPVGQIDGGGNMRLLNLGPDIGPTSCHYSNSVSFAQ